MNRERQLTGWRVPALIVLAVMAVRAQTFADPVLGFDEQYYLLVADRWLHGELPYVDIWDRKPLGLFMLYALALVPVGDPFVLYKLLAAGFVAATALTIRRAVLREAGEFGATAAALLYVCWLNFMEGEGGQSPVFYNLPVLLAALLMRRALERRGPLDRCGLAAMLLMGLAIQIKYTAVFEAAFFGLLLVRAAQREWGVSPRLAGWALVWAIAALGPTMMAWTVYAAMGHGQAFLFANFLSIFGRLPDPLADRMAGLAAIVLILSPLVVLAALARRRGRRLTFVQRWALAALLAVLLFGAFLSPSYGLPLVAPLCLCAAPWLGRSRVTRTVTLTLLALAFVGGTLAVRQIIIGKGGRAEALAVAAAARPLHGGCIWVWDGYPALYQLTGSCVPTRWAFPGHLNTADEGSARAIGIEPETEVRRILATRPEAIVSDAPAYRLGNPATRALVEAELARSYRLVAQVPTGPGRVRLVYRLLSEAP
jgi:hypothetical protein